MPFDMPVVRYEVGLAMRPIEDPPYERVLPTIRFHVPGPVGWGLQPYIDFSNRLLINRVLAIYKDLAERAHRLPPKETVELAVKLLPTTDVPLTLRLTRHGQRLETTYDVEVLET